MKIKANESLKKLALSKANVQIVAVSAVASFITVFCLVTANYLLGIRSYQSKIIAADNTAYSQLKTDVVAKNNLESSYQSFVQQNPNVLGTSIVNTPGYTYNNSTIILDALPSRYDFPAVVTSIDKMLQNGNFNVTSIGGTDASASTSNTPESNPQPVSIPFTFTINQATYLSVQSLFSILQSSIRPMIVDSVTLSGQDSNMSISVTAHTYFQPAKLFSIGTETINP